MVVEDADLDHLPVISALAEKGSARAKSSAIRAFMLRIS